MSAAPNGTNQREAYLNNKETQYNSKAKNLLYGGDGDRPLTPAHNGKKSVAHRDGAAVPYATFDGNAQPLGLKEVQGGQVTKTYQARNGKKEGAGKVSNMEFDPDVYRQALADNVATRTAQKARNWGSSNLLGTHPQTPKTPGEGPLEDEVYTGAHAAHYT